MNEERELKTMIVIWNNGDKEKIKITRRVFEAIDLRRVGFKEWVLAETEGKGGWNMEYARKVYFED